MVKKNKVFIGVLVLLIVLSVGYALFSETITINGTATAKGNFDIEVACDKGLTDLAADLYGSPKESGYLNDKCDVSGPSVVYSADLTMPSALRFFTITLKNAGTIDAQFNMEELFVTTDKTCVDSDGDKQITSSDTCTADQEMASFETVTFLGKNGSPIEETELGTLMNEDTGMITLPEGYSILGVARLYWNPNGSYSSNEYNHKLIQSTQTIKVNLNQATN